MSDAKTTVELEYAARMESVFAELKKTEAFSDKTAKKIAQDFFRSMRSTDQAAAKSAGKSKEAWGNAAQTAEGFKRIADAAGGSAAGYAGTIEHLAKSAGALSATLGPAGVAAVAATVAVGGLALAGAAAALSAGRLIEELDTAGRTPVVSQAQIKSTWELDGAVTELVNASKEAAVVLGVEFAPALTTIVQATAAAIDVTKDWIPLITDVASGTLNFVAAITGLWALDIPGRLEAMAWSQGKVGIAVDDTTLAYMELGRSWNQQAPKIAKDLADQRAAWKRHQDAIAKTAAEQARATATITQAETQLTALYHSSYASLLEGEESIRWAYGERLQAVSDLVAKGADLELADATRTALTLAHEQEISEFHADAIAKRQDAAEKYHKAVAAAREKELDDAKTAHDEQVAQARELRDARLSAGASVAAMIETVASTQIRASEDSTKAQKRAAMIAFRVAQGAAIAQIAINTAQAIMQGYAQLGPVAGNFSAIAMTATGLAQGALVAARQPPQFDQGGIVEPYQMGASDHRPVLASPGEGFLTRSGVANAGGPDGVRDLNQGRGNVSSSPLQVNLMIGHRYLERLQRQRRGRVDRALLDRFGPIGQVGG